ncbi:MAG: sulfate adenylyltransferase subunit 2 [Bacteroidales bacterium]|nr:sulfate adenylyltransferase subunit 2 [Bacteroidales bacterium]
MINKYSHLKELENEAIFIIRQGYTNFRNCALLFSGGKDSTVLLHLAFKAFYPAKIPFPLLHIDTGHNFPETIEFRDNVIKKYNCECIVRYVEDTIKQGKAKEENGFDASRNILQSITLLDAIREFGFDCIFGGGRRDEEKARAKERFFSYRNNKGQWLPEKQRPEVWYLFNTLIKEDEHFRVFPLNNWTELDIWLYIYLENIEIPSIYFSHKRKVFKRNDTWLAYAPFIKLRPTEKVVTKTVRCRTVGDITCTGLILSRASSLEDIIVEIASSRITERGNRYDDKRSDTSMEDRKRNGYF